MSNLNLKWKEDNTFDAIVIGTGISGGWAAKELCEKGLKTLVLERGRNVRHVIDYPTMNMAPWEFKYGDKLTREEVETNYRVQDRTGYVVKQSTKHFFVKDTEHPYSEVKRFDWIRGYHVGGRSLIWGRQSYRLSDLDFEANARDGHGVDWPIRYKDISSWYDYVEKFAGINGRKEGLSQLPDGQFLPALELNCVEKHVREKVMEHFGRTLTIGRSANLTQPHNGRGKCQSRNLCVRGCPYGGYFSSNAATLPAAELTGNMTLRPNAIATEILYDKDKKRAKGVRIIDAETNETLDFYARIVFCNASTLNSTHILMNSAKEVFPDGLGSSSGELGHNLMDHHFRVGAEGNFDGFQDKYYRGRRPSGIYLARFRNLGDKASERKDYLRGFGYQGGASRMSWSKMVAELGFGAEFKENLKSPGMWRMGLLGFGEHLPYHENKIEIDNDNLDKWGQSTLKIDCEFKENERIMRKDMKEQAAEMLDASGFNNISTYDHTFVPGNGIHEMGTARMGKNPKSSVLNKHNQVWDAPNVFVTDGACMTSSGCQNPSLTYMALTARACDFAYKELNRNNL